MKKQSNLSQLMGYAGRHKILTYLSWVLSAMSALLALVPFWYIWRIIHDVLKVAPDFARAENITRYGWSAVLSAILSILVYSPAAWYNGKVWKRKTTEDCKQFQCRYGNVSGAQASRQSGGNCHPHRIDLFTAWVRLEVRYFKPYSRCAWFSNYDEDDRERYG